MSHTFNFKSSFECNRKFFEQLFTLLSPVIIMTRMPAFLHSAIASRTSNRGGSSMPTAPTKVALLSYLANLVESCLKKDYYFLEIIFIRKNLISKKIIKT